MLINGRQVYLDNYGMTVWQTLPVQLSEIRQIEVVKGPNCALFGFNAVSGVINIITYNPKFDDTNVVTAQVGDHGQQSGSLATTFKLGDSISARLSGGVRQQNEWSTAGSSVLASTVENPQYYNMALDVVAQLAPKTELRVEGSLANSRQDGLVANTYAIFNMITTSGMATLTSDTDYGTIQARAYRNQLSSKYELLGDFVNTITVVSLQDLFKIGTDNTIRIGGEYRHNTLNTGPLTGGNISYDVLSASAMWNWAVTDQVTTTTAIRVDTLNLSRKGTFPARIPMADNSLWNRTITEPSANVTAAWRPSAVDTFRLSFARGVQAPSLAELGSLQIPNSPFPGFTIDIMGNPNLKPSLVTNYELAYDRAFSFAKIGLRMFLQDWKNMPGTNTSAVNIPATATTNNAIVIYSNVSNSEMKGVEFNASGKIVDGLTWRGDYTHTDVKDLPFPGVNTAANLVAFQQTTPKYRGNVGLTWSDNSLWEADANLHYVGHSQGYNNITGALQPVGAYASLDSRLAYRIKDYGVTLALSGQNLTQGRQAQTTGLEAERRVQFTLSKDW